MWCRHWWSACMLIQFMQKWNCFLARVRPCADHSGGLELVNRCPLRRWVRARERNVVVLIDSPYCENGVNGPRAITQRPMPRLLLRLKSVTFLCVCSINHRCHRVAQEGRRVQAMRPQLPVCFSVRVTSVSERNRIHVIRSCHCSGRRKVEFRGVDFLTIVGAHGELGTQWGFGGFAPSGVKG